MICWMQLEWIFMMWIIRGYFPGGLNYPRQRFLLARELCEEDLVPAVPHKTAFFALLRTSQLTELHFMMIENIFKSRPAKKRFLLL